MMFYRREANHIKRVQLGCTLVSLQSLYNRKTARSYATGGATREDKYDWLPVILSRAPCGELLEDKETREGSAARNASAHFRRVFQVFSVECRE